jgi:uncharacterized protein (DUF1800 family)
MELHTLGVRTGYSQADVTEFARALTGWTVGGIGRGPGARMLGNAPAGDFQFADLLHEPGDRTIMGKRYRQDGEAQARAVLMDLAASPATARHLATKLARHFAGDEPPPALVERLSRAYLASGGDLPSVCRALIESSEPWAPQPLKFKSLGTASHRCDQHSSAGASRPAEAARSADLAAGIARGLGRHCRELGGARSARPSRRGRAAHRRQRRIER